MRKVTLSTTLWPVIAPAFVMALFVTTCTFCQDWRVPGSQRCAVISCGGSSTSDNTYRPDKVETPKGPSKRQLEIDRANAIHDQSNREARAGNFARAIELAREAQEIAKDHKWLKDWIASLEQFLRAHAEVELAYDAYRKSDLRSAASHLRSAMAIEPRAISDRGREWLNSLTNEVKVADSIKESVASINGFKVTAPEVTNTPFGDPMVVDLTDAKTYAIDPKKLKAPPKAIRNLPPVTGETQKAERQSMLELAKRSGWADKELARLSKALEALKLFDNGVDIYTQGDVWEAIRSRTGASEVARFAATLGPVNWLTAGQQNGTNDCTVFALASAAGLPYGIVANRAALLITDGGWRTPAERANPEAVFKRGLDGYEVLMLAEALGEVEVIEREAFVDTLAKGQPVLLGIMAVDPPDANGDFGYGFHEVVLTKSFQYKGETWFELMDSNQPATARRYITSSELDKIRFENGVSYRPDTSKTVIPLRQPE